MTEHDTKTAVLGGKEIEVEFLSGEKKRITVKVLSIRQLHESAQLGGEDAELCELYCGQEKGWADKLKPESVFEVVQEGDDLNFTAFEALQKRRLIQAKRARKYMDEMEKAGMLLDRNSGSPLSTQQLS